MARFGDMSRMREYATNLVNRFKRNQSSEDSQDELVQPNGTTEAVIQSTPLWRKKSVIIIGSAVIAVAAAAIIGIQQYKQYIHNNTFEIFHVYQNGEYIGSVDEVAAVQKLIDEEQLELASNNPGISMELNTGEITYESESGFKLTASTEETLSKLESTFTSNAVGIAIVVDGKTLGYVKDEAAASNILSRVQKQYAPQAAAEADTRKFEALSFSAAAEAESAEPQAAEKELTEIGESALSIKEVQFVEAVDLSVNQVEPTDIMDEEELYKKIIDGSTKPTKYVVQKGDCIGCIAQKFGISEQVIYENNPSIVGDRITAGEELDLTVRMPEITVRSIEQLVEIEEIAIPIQYVENKEVREGQTRTLQTGKTGSQRLTYEITKENGYIVSEELVAQDVITEAVPTIIEKGTMIVAGVGSGQFAYPVTNYRISSKYGKRWGKLHAGVDFTGNKNIKASDAGVVEFVGNKNGYGKTIIIDHKNGFKTLYGHLSSYSVSKGDKVEKGDKIGVMGNTGRSTGTHLHFEIIKNGSTVNPLKYL